MRWMWWLWSNNFRRRRSTPGCVLGSKFRVLGLILLWFITLEGVNSASEMVWFIFRLGKVAKVAIRVLLWLMIQGFRCHF